MNIIPHSRPLLLFFALAAFAASCGIDSTGALFGGIPGPSGSTGTGGIGGSSSNSGGQSSTGGNQGGENGTGGQGGVNGTGGNMPVAVCGDGIVTAPEQCEDKLDATCTGCVFCTGPGEFLDAATQHCYRLVDTSVTWGAARSDCLNWGGDLAGISTKAEFDFLATHTNPDINKDTWIGGKSVTPLCSYAWSNGEPWRSQWADNEPGTNAEACLYLWMSKGKKFDDILCDGTLAYLCERAPAATCGNSMVEPGETCDDGNTQGGDDCSPICQVSQPCALIPGSFQDAGTGHCYWLHTNENNFATAKDICESESGYLVSIDSATENALIKQHVVAETYIGAWEGQGNGGYIVWEQPPTDCTYKNYDNDSKDPNEDCLRMIPASGQWRDAGCDIKFDFMCERDY